MTPAPLERPGVWPTPSGGADVDHSTCHACGGEVEQPGRGRPRKFCLACRPRTYQPRPRKPPAPKRSRSKPPRVVVCVECSQEFLTKTRAKCCDACRPARRLRQSLASMERLQQERRSILRCDVCGEPMPAGRWLRCSPECTEIGKRHYRNGWPPNECLLNWRPCMDCGVPFIVRRETGSGRRRCPA